MARWLESRGRRLVGWDEMLEGGLEGLPHDAVIMSWRVSKGIPLGLKGVQSTHRIHELVAMRRMGPCGGWSAARCLPPELSYFSYIYRNGIGS